MKTKAYLIVILIIFWGMFFMDHAQAQVVDSTIDYRYAGEVIRDSTGKTARSAKPLIAFKKLWPCPATGKKNGACPGWAVDHVIPLDCGGRDAVFNMQWLPDQIKSVTGPFSKDHFERRIYGGHGVSPGCP
jgi:hypothetical protein